MPKNMFPHLHCNLFSLWYALGATQRKGTKWVILVTIQVSTWAASIRKENPPDSAAWKKGTKVSQPRFSAQFRSSVKEESKSTRTPKIIFFWPLFNPHLLQEFGGNLEMVNNTFWQFHNGKYFWFWPYLETAEIWCLLTTIGTSPWLAHGTVSSTHCKQWSAQYLCRHFSDHHPISMTVCFVAHVCRSQKNIQF